MSFVDLFGAMVLALVTLFASMFLLRVIVFGALMRRRGCRHGHHGHHGHHGVGGARRAWRLFRELRLSREQRGQLRSLFIEVRGQMRELRGDLPADLARVLGGPVFDRGAAESVAEQRLAALSTAKDKMLDALARVHGVLTPEQRAKVAAFSAA